MTLQWELDLATATNSVFYEPIRSLPTDADMAAVAQDLLPRWESHVTDMWFYWAPPGFTVAEQGWKIHVSSVQASAMAALEATVKTCLDQGAPFKFARSRTHLGLLNGKYAPRSASGKFITIYTAGEKQLEDICTRLTVLTRGQDGPRILSDVKLGDVVYARYGAFKMLTCDQDGIKVPALRAPNGKLVPDVRQPYFSAPDWLTLPEFIQAAYESDPDRVASTPPVLFEGVLQFTNSGGVYRGLDPAVGESIVIIEGRPGAGIALDGSDSFDRVGNYSHVLRELNQRSVQGVPRLARKFDVGSHTYAAISKVDGRTLIDEMLDRHPMLNEVPPCGQSLREYAEWVQDAWRSVCGIVRQMHKAGWAHGDIHPGNVMMDRQNRPTLVDFEYSRELTADAPMVAAPGYTPPVTMSCKDSDDFQLRILLSDLLIPLPHHLREGIDQSAHLIDEILRTYDLAPDAIEALSSLRLLPPVLHQAKDSGELSARLLKAAGLAASESGTVPSGPAFHEGGEVSLLNGHAGLVHAQSIIFGTPNPYAVRQLRTLLKHRPSAPGLLRGTVGALLVLARTGEEDLPLDKAGCGRFAVDEEIGLAGGLAGEALGLLRLSQLTEETYLRAAASRCIDVVLDRIKTERWRGATQGLLTGRAGVAYALTEVAADLNDHGLEELAHSLLLDEMEEFGVLCPGDQRMFENREWEYGIRRIPYVDSGSAGWLLAAVNWMNRFGTSPDLGAWVPTIVRSCKAKIVREPGLLNGRAGLAVALKIAGEDAQAQNQMQNLSLQLVRWRGYPAAKGRKSLRLSMDIESGNAGISLAAAYIDGQIPDFALHPDVVFSAPKSLTHDESGPAS